jgi:hypothetical protein
LEQLERAHFLTNDEPYAGSLSSNHTLLYYTQGPDILKRLKALEDLDHQERHRIFGMDHDHRSTEEVKPKAPRRRLPYDVYRSPYRHARRQFTTEVDPGQKPLVAGAGLDYLLDPVNIPLRVGPEEQQVLERIDGKRDLREILEGFTGKAKETATSFLVRLVATGMVELESENPRPRPVNHGA